MAGEDEPTLAADKQEQDIEHIRRRLDMLDQRLDNVDSVLTAVVERVMSQPLTLNMLCPRCGKNIEISVIGTEKPTR